MGPSGSGEPLTHPTIPLSSPGTLAGNWYHQLSDLIDIDLNPTLLILMIQCPKFYFYSCAGSSIDGGGLDIEPQDLGQVDDLCDEKEPRAKDKLQSAEILSERRSIID